VPPPESKPEAERDPFFIGWEQVPRRYARFLAAVAWVLIAVLAVGGAVLAWGQRSPGPGTWADDTSTVTIIVYAEPYAMVRVPGESGAPPRTLLLVCAGKFGAKNRVKPHDGKPVRVSGTLISRDGWQMLELVDGDEGVRRRTPRSRARCTPVPAGEPARPDLSPRGDRRFQVLPRRDETRLRARAQGLRGAVPEGGRPARVRFVRRGRRTLSTRGHGEGRGQGRRTGGRHRAEAQDHAGADDAERPNREVAGVTTRVAERETGATA